MSELLDDIFGLPDAASWIDRAACADDPDLFLDDDPAAARICARCPVRATCLDYALEHDERFGVWGGLNARERARLQGRRAPRVSASRPLRSL